MSSLASMRAALLLCGALCLCGAGQPGSGGGELSAHATRVSLTRLRGGILGRKRRRERRAQEEAEEKRWKDELALDPTDIDAQLEAELAEAGAADPIVGAGGGATMGGEGAAGAAPNPLVAALLGAVTQQQQQRTAGEAAPGGEPADEETATPLGAALKRLHVSAGPAYPLALETLGLLISNIIEQPDEPRFRRLRLTNPLIKARIRTLDGGFECLRALGFRQEGDQGDAAAYVLDAEALDIEALKAAQTRFFMARRRALEKDRESKAAVSGLLEQAPPAVRAALDSDGEMRSAASAMVAHPLFSFLMADGGYRAAAQAAVQEERSLRSLIENFTTGRVERVSSREAWFDLLLENSIVVAVFSTKWCSPCQLLKPIVAHLSQIPSMRKLKFVTVDCDELPQVAQEAMVASFPTVKVYSDCREQESVVGGDVQKLVRVLETAAGPGYSR